MLKKIKQLFFKREAPVIIPEVNQKKEVPVIEICKQYRENEPPIVHFQTANNIEQYKSYCIGTLCKHHLTYIKTVSKKTESGECKNFPVYMSEYQIMESETHRYTSDATKVTCPNCIKRLNTKK